MKNYLSLGMGVGSVALMFDMIDDGLDFEAVWVDHGCDWPETRSYADYLESKGYKFKRLIPEHKGFTNIYDFCMAKKIVPLKQIRWCTAEFKIKPFNKYVGTPCIVYLGITNDEKHRAKYDVSNGRQNRYPLIEKKISRHDAVKLIERHGMNIPQRSTCWFCPFQSKDDIRRLYLTHPELYQKMKTLESSCCRPGYYLFEQSLKSFVPEGCTRLDDMIQAQRGQEE